MPYEEMVPPMTAFGTYARWRVQWQEAQPVEFYQLCPQICDPARDILPYLKRLTEKFTKADGTFEPVGEIVSPGCCDPQPEVGDRRSFAEAKFKDPLVVAMFSTWMELTESKQRGDAAYDWELWYGPGHCTVAFRRYDVDGRPVAIHTVHRKSLDEALEDLSINHDFDLMKHGI